MGIQITVHESQQQQSIPEGLYKATVKGLEEKTGNFGPYFRITFEILEGQYKGVTKSLVASQKLSRSKDGKNSKLFDVVNAVLKGGVKIGDTLDVETLVGKQCQIFVKNKNEKDGVIFQDVDTVMPM